jgi:hypothetical protein
MEDVVLNRVAVEQLLAQLGPEHRLVLELVYGIYRPTDWPWPDQRWPPTYASVGWYVGSRFRGKPLSEAAIRYISAAALRKLAALHSD